MYLSEEGRPGLQFLKDVQFFYPKKIVVMSSNLTGVPDWSDVPQSEIDRYASNLGPAAVKKAALSSSVDFLLFWNSCIYLTGQSFSQMPYPSFRPCKLAKTRI